MHPDVTTLTYYLHTAERQRKKKTLEKRSGSFQERERNITYQGTDMRTVVR